MSSARQAAPAPRPHRSRSQRLQAAVPAADRFLDLRRDWGQLLRDSATRSMFLSWEWQEAWWRHMGDGEPWPVTLRRGDELTGIVPLYRHKERWYGVGMRVLRLVGDGSFDGDDLDAIVRGGNERAAALALLRHLRERRDWDLLQLHPVPGHSSFLRALRRAADAAGHVTRLETYGCTHTPLPDSWDAYLATLPSRLRSRVRALLRGVVDDAAYQVRRAETAAQLDEALDVLFDLHQRRWQAIGQPGSFADVRRCELYRDFAFRALQHGWLRLYTLWQGERPLAAQIGYVWDGVFLQVQEGFDPEVADASPGVALRAAVLRDCIADGLRAYDNLLGTPPQKMRWGGVQRLVHRFSVARRGSAASLVLRARNRWRPPTDAGAGAQPGAEG